MARSTMGTPGKTAVAPGAVEEVNPNDGAGVVMPPTPKPSLGDMATTAVAEPDASKASRGEHVITTAQTMTPSSSARTTPSREQQLNEKEPEQLPEQETCREEHLGSLALPAAPDRVKPAQSRKRSRFPKKKKRVGNEFALKPGNDYGPCAGVEDCIVVGGGPPPSEHSDQEDDGVDVDSSVDLDNSSSPDVDSSSGSQDVAMSEVPDDDNLPLPPLRQSPAIRSRPASVDSNAGEIPTPPHRPSGSTSPGPAQMPEVSRIPPPPITIRVVPPTPVLQQTNSGDSACHHGHQQRHVGHQCLPHAFPPVSGGVAPAPIHHLPPARYESQQLERPPYQEHSPSFDGSHNPYARATYYASAATAISRQFHPGNHPQPHHQQPPYPQLQYQLPGPLRQQQLPPHLPWSQQQHQQDQRPRRLPGNLAPAHRPRPQHQESQAPRRLSVNLAPAHRSRAPVRYRARTPPLAHPESSCRLPSFAELTRGVDMSLPPDHPSHTHGGVWGANRQQGRYRYHPYSRAT